MKFFYILIQLLCTVGVTIAQTDTTYILAQEQHSSGVAGAPYIKYAPETGFVGGVVGIYYFHLNHDSAGGSANRPSSISFGASYTQKKQFASGIDYTLYFSHDDYYIFGGLDFKRTPFDFFGIGNDNPKDPIDTYTPLWRGGDILMTRNIYRTEKGEGFNAGLGMEVRNDILLSSTPGGILQSGNVPGAKGGLSSGLGIIVNYDTRDNIFSSLAGQFAEMRTFFYSSAFGSTFDFIRLTLDFRDFESAFANHTIAMQGLLTLAKGNEPFFSMAQLGGESVMRGIFQGRYTDRDMAILQGEYRMPVIWRFGIVGFADIGEVANTVNHFSLSGIKWTAGAGLRFLFTESERLMVRLDYGFTNDSSELYFFVNEAF